MTETEILHTCKKDFKKGILTKLKIELYVNLLNMTNDEITKEEVDIMVAISKDEDVQKILENKRKEDKRRKEIKNGILGCG